MILCFLATSNFATKGIEVPLSFRSNSKTIKVFVDTGSAVLALVTPTTAEAVCQDLRISPVQLAKPILTTTFDRIASKSITYAIYALSTVAGY